MSTFAGMGARRIKREFGLVYTEDRIREALRAGMKDMPSLVAYITQQEAIGKARSRKAAVRNADKFRDWSVK